MRLAFPEQPRLDCPSVAAVPLNLNCRDEIIPILRALQHLYEQTQVRRELLELIGKDVNPDSSPDRGREGLSYWTIMVLAAVRLGCNFDYDKLQDLAEQHRTLRLIMGIGAWDEQTDFDWRRIRDNLCLLRPATLEKINRNFSITLKRGAADRWGCSYAMKHGERTPATSGNSSGATDPFGGSVARSNLCAARSHCQTRGGRAAASR